MSYQLGVIDADGKKIVTSHANEEARAAAAATAIETALAVWRIEHDQVWKKMM